MMQATLGEKILSQACIWSKLYNSLGLWVLENHYITLSLYSLNHQMGAVIVFFLLVCYKWDNIWKTHKSMIGI